MAEARAGKRVVLVDLDLRRPRIEKFFRLEGRPGLTNVILGHASVDEATAHIAISNAERKNGRTLQSNGHVLNGNGNGSGNGHPSLDGLLDVIPAGPIPPDPGEFVATAALARLLETLSNRYDLVLIDAPPLLRVGDALTLASRVSSLMIVSSLPAAKRHTPHTELRRVLEYSVRPAPSAIRSDRVLPSRQTQQYWVRRGGYAYDYKQKAKGRARQARDSEQVS